ncbi:expressed unknown protein [Seminavis robusta]|uniref:Uncharacterized protein n=1 Tax=Seminavis robusta TaxID=568900 RepID=A0A9N8E1W5_9STRA|nr:expressed unknown protein [Seminavis robusta]|eukprot:Sro461_g147870.1 n/a (729) ;mRNA; f:61268-63454
MAAAKEDSTRAEHSGDFEASAIGTGPLFHRHEVVGRRVGGRNKKRKKKPYCFTWISFVTCLLTMEACAMIFMMFRSHTMIFIDPLSSLEEDALDFLVWLDTTLGGGGQQDREELAELEAHLVQMTEDRLDHGYALEHEVETTAIDNYYNRSSTKNNNDHPPSTVLLVAGMKGSGARAVVDALIQLHIPMITLDRADTQKDSDRKAFHTGQMAWRNMINLVMSSGIRTPNYEFSQLPQLTQLRIRQEWEKFYQGFIAKHIPQQQSTTTHHQNSNQILFGFQAHDSLLMIPVVQEFVLLGQQQQQQQQQQQPLLKVIQVLRDGRDVSLLSPKTEIGNDKKEHPMQSMAERFVLETFYDVSNISKSYDDTATSLISREHQRIVESMELWSDWNHDAHIWLQNRNHDKNGHLEYLQLRTEDLLSPEKKLEALLQLSNFTEATIPFQQLCCMSRQAMVIENPSESYLKGFAKARAQHNLLQKYSAELSFLHNEQDEDERRRARLGDLVGGKHRFGGRRHNNEPEQPSSNNALHQQVHQHRQDRFQDIGDRLAARMPNQGRRRLLNDIQTGTSTKARHEETTKSPEVSKLFDEYFAWRKSLGNAKKDKDAAVTAIETGEKLLADYRTHHDHLKGVLTEDSFVRSIKWLKNLHNRQNSKVVDDGSEETTEIASLHSPQHYGKWVHWLKDEPLLSRRLHSVGNLTLRAFGYEPRARFMDFDPENRKAQCHMVVTCY